jgi:hypothetical protein
LYNAATDVGSCFSPIIARGSKATVVAIHTAGCKLMGQLSNQGVAAVNFQ